ncbi:MAG TPA: CBS domain-containing protein [Candidatus Limnocylindrales bacterium]|jgi:CBS domain-containing protein
MTASLAGRSVAELMTRDPIVANVDMPLLKAAQLMDLNRVSGLPVIDAGGRLVGVISQTDLLHARTTEALWREWPGLTVRHLMSQPAVAVRSDATIAEAAELMERARIHRVVVLAADGEAPIGVLSVTDLVRDMAAGDES